MQKCDFFSKIKKKKRLTNKQATSPPWDAASVNQQLSPGGTLGRWVLCLFPVMAGCAELGTDGVSNPCNASAITRRCVFRGANCAH